MQLGTPHTLVHAAHPQAAPPPDRDAAEAPAVTPATAEPVERVIVVQEPDLPDHVGDLAEELAEPSD